MSLEPVAERALYDIDAALVFIVTDGDQKFVLDAAELVELADLGGHRLHWLLDPRRALAAVGINGPPKHIAWLKG